MNGEVLEGLDESVAEGFIVIRLERLMLGLPFRATTKSNRHGAPELSSCKEESVAATTY